MPRLEGIVSGNDAQDDQRKQMRPNHHKTYSSLSFALSGVVPNPELKEKVYLACQDHPDFANVFSRKKGKIIIAEQKTEEANALLQSVFSDHSVEYSSTIYIVTADDIADSDQKQHANQKSHTMRKTEKTTPKSLKSLPKITPLKPQPPMAPSVWNKPKYQINPNEVDPLQGTMPYKPRSNLTYLTDDLDVE